MRIARRAIGGVVKPEDESEDADEALDEAEDEGRVADSEDFVSAEVPEDSAALDRR